MRSSISRRLSLAVCLISLTGYLGGIGLLVGGCASGGGGDGGHGGDGPTPEQCRAAGLAGHTACDLTLADRPEDLARCHAGVTLAETLCLVAAEPEPAPGPAGFAVMSGAPTPTKRDRAREAFPLWVEGKLTAEAFRDYVLNRPDAP